MIYTVTFNPSLDYMVDVPNFKLGYTNRCVSEVMYAGGKGINVSMVLENLGHRSVSLGFMAGFVGKEIVAQLEQNNQITSDFIALDEGNSRVNVKLKSSDGTEINAQGPEIPQEKVEQFFTQMSALNKGDILVLGGSIPPSLSNDIYMEIMSKSKSQKIVVDATGDLLVKALEYKPWLVKPNRHELEEIFSVKIEGKRSISKYAEELQKKGARNVIVSLGGDGAYLLDENGKSYFSKVPEGKLINAVGSGDSMVAGFIAGYIDSKYDYETAFKTAVATGSGSAFSERFATKELVTELMKQL